MNIVADRCYLRGAGLRIHQKPLRRADLLVEHGLMVAIKQWRAAPPVNRVRPAANLDIFVYRAIPPDPRREKIPTLGIGKRPHAQGMRDLHPLEAARRLETAIIRENERPGMQAGHPLLQQPFPDFSSDQHRNPSLGWPDTRSEPLKA